MGPVLCLLTAVSGVTWAVEYNLRADVTDVTMPDGQVIPMWGFALDSAFGAEDGTVTVPGPELTVSPDDDTLTIVVKNNLTAERTGLDMGCPVCIVIPGQITPMTPVRFGSAPYPEFEGRIRSLTYETPPGNTSPVVYTWSNVKPGTYLYHSGTHMQCHVQMGLYGALTHDAVDGEAYPGVAYDQEILLLYSEIDPVFHAAVASADYGPDKTMTSTIDYKPRYFLINGQPFGDPGKVIPSVNTGERVLLRFLNAGLETHVPTLLGTHVRLLAEDGNLYPHVKEQYSVVLPAGKTVDALLEPGATGRLPILDRRLNLTNDTEPDGGMLAYVNVQAPADEEQANP